MNSVYKLKITGLHPTTITAQADDKLPVVVNIGPPAEAHQWTQPRHIPVRFEGVRWSRRRTANCPQASRRIKGRRKRGDSRETVGCKFAFASTVFRRE